LRGGKDMSFDFLVKRFFDTKRLIVSSLVTIKNIHCVIKNISRSDIIVPLLVFQEKDFPATEHYTNNTINRIFPACCCW
jgi:hypothetical protein